MTYITVVNLATGERKMFTCPPLEAVVAAHAESMGDHDPGELLTKYQHRVQSTDYAYYLGDFGVLRQPAGDFPKLAWVAENLTI